jgi:putative peptide maturation dehydrogenase
VRKEGDLYNALAHRRTARAFDTSRGLSLEELATLLYEVFGCRGYTEIHPEFVALRKSSPSGGGLHPIEVYPLVQRVDGLEPGLYHYAVGEHALEVVAQVDTGALLRVFTAGQTWLGSAAAAFVLTARFDRVFWKYPRQGKAYATVLIDAGHLSQTFYLVCTDLGLACSVTDVINGANIEETLGIDGVAEGAIALLACGLPAAQRSPLEPEFQAYVPGKTRI